MKRHTFEKRRPTDDSYAVLINFRSGRAESYRLAPAQSKEALSEAARHAFWPSWDNGASIIWPHGALLTRDSFWEWKIKDGDLR